MTERVPVSDEVFLAQVDAAMDELERALAALVTNRCMDCQRRLYVRLMRCGRCARLARAS